MIVHTLRGIYLLLVLVGLIVSFGELRAASVIYSMLVKARINGIRQLVASQSFRRAMLSVLVQLSLCFPAAVTMAIAPSVSKEWRHHPVMGMLSVLSSLMVPTCLMVKSLMSWYDRSVTMNMLEAQVPLVTPEQEKA